MMKHKRRAEGGRVRDAGWDGKYGDDDRDEAPGDVYSGKSSHVAQEAKGEMAGKRKRGGRVEKEERKEEKREGHKRHERAERKHGGRVHVGNVEGGGAKHRLDRPGRKRGGGIGADTTPLSTAARTSDRKGGEEDRRSGGM